VKTLRWRRVALALSVLAGASLPAPADFLVLKDGRVVEGKKLARVEGGIEIAYQNGKVLVPTALVGDVLIEGEALAPPANTEEESQRAKGMVRFENKWMTPKSRDELLKKRLDKRMKEFGELKAHSEWRNRYTEKTRNFAFEHTLPPEVFEEYRDLMEAYFAQFTKDWKIKLPKDLGPLKVCLYTNYEDMIQIGGAGQGVLGYFRFREPLELNFFHDRLDQAFTEEVMFHETNHYLQKLIDMDFGMPHFPGESLAEYYGASHWDPEKKKLTTGLILEGRLVEVQDEIAGGEWMDLKKLVSSDGLYEHYTWGWTLVHFLMTDKRYSAKFQRFVIALPTAKDIKREDYGGGLKTVGSGEVYNAFVKYLELKDDEGVKALEKEWHTYVREKLTLVTPRGKELAAASASFQRPIKAKRLFKEAIEGGTKNPLTYHRYADLLSSSGEIAQAIELWKKAIELDPLIGDFYYRMGRAIRTKDKEEGKRLMKLAKEVDPEGNYFDIEEEEKAKGGDKNG
jgi:tetratricopeptide (TPR) repeat protein